MNRLSGLLAGVAMLAISASASAQTEPTSLPDSAIATTDESAGEIVVLGFGQMTR